MSHEARTGRLPIADGDYDFIERRNDADEIIRRTERTLKDTCACRREDFRAWLGQHGSELDRQSRAATWAEHQPAKTIHGSDLPPIIRAGGEDEAALA